MDQEPQPQSSGRGAALSLILAIFFGGGFLVFLILVTGGFFVYVVSAVVGMALLGLLHYVVWGESMTQEVAAERAEEEAREQIENERAMAEHPHGIRRI